METLSPLQNKQTAHTLFIDFVGYTRLSESGQVAVQRELAEIVLHTAPVRRNQDSSSLTTRRTGDGMMLVFLTTAEDAARCAVEIDAQVKQRSRALRETVGGPFRLRMGVHSGPVVRFDDQDGVELAGDGINIAQRVMDAGDDGHILVSSTTADALKERQPWSNWLHELGPCRVKHDEMVHLWNVHGAHPDGLPLGYEAVPRTVFASQEQSRRLLERDIERDRESNRAWGMGVAAKWATVGAGVGAMVLVGAMLTRNTPGAARDISSFSQKLSAAAKTRQSKDNARSDSSTSTAQGESPAPNAAQTTPSPNQQSAIPSGAEQSAEPPASSPTTETTGPSVDADVPDLTGLNAEEAKVKLENAGLVLGLPPGSGLPVGKVVGQNPPPGRSRVANGAVFITVSENELPDER